MDPEMEPEMDPKLDQKWNQKRIASGEQKREWKMQIL